MREQIERRYGVALADRTIRDALLIVAEPRRYHPVRSYLRSLKWDGVARLDSVASEVLGAKQALAPSMVRKFFLAAVARALDPGCKVDNALVLVGAQGARKSTFFRTLAGAWFSDTHMDPTNKDALQQIAAAWIYELGEIDSITSRKHASDLKRFMTSATDAFRPPYERSIRIVQRSGIMVGTTNRDRFLTDETGSRRFWVVRVPDRVNIALLARERDQLWAEAVVALSKKEPWWLTDAEEIVREVDAEQHAEQDPWRDLVARYFQGLFRQQQLRGDYTCAEIAAEVLKVERRDLARSTEQRLGDVLRSLGLTRRKLRIERDGRRLNPTWAWLWPDEEPEWLHTEIAASHTAEEAGFA
jgi:predicted P-loop ATPase